MSSDLIIDVSPDEIVIALLENKRLVELTRERSGAKFAVGDIYLGKVKKIMPSLNAVFVDVGYDKDAFLHYLDLGPQFSTLDKFFRLVSAKSSKITSIGRIQREPDIKKEGKVNDLLKTGQRILVQVAKEPISSKGPRLTSELSIAGRNMVLLPFSDRISISQKIKTNEEKNRLKKLISSIRPRNYGVIVRTAAEGKMVAELDQELKKLMERWESTFPKQKRLNAPALVMSEIDRTTSLIRDIYHTDFNSIIVNDQAVSEEVADYLALIDPEKRKLVKLYKGKAPIFEHFGVDKQVKGSFGKTVSFRSGAYLIIEHTEAFHVIDVNSGNRTKSGLDQENSALEVNLAACEEIARQLRLRDMGGIIVIDFIDMHSPSNRTKVYEYMKELMSADRTKHNILPLSKFCLMQITRQRVRPEEHVETAEICPVCKGSGKITPTILFADELDHKVEYILKDLNKSSLTMIVHPYLAAYFTKGPISIRVKWFFKFFRWVRVKTNPAFSLLEYKFLDENNETIII